MIRRWLIGLGAVVLAAAGVVLPEPPPEPVALDVRPVEAPGETAVSGIAYCPWSEATDRVDTVFALTSMAAGEGILSFPSGGESGHMDPFQIGTGPGGQRVLLSDLRRPGDAPAVAEFSDGPAGTGALVRSEGRLSGDVCPSSLPKVWQLPGGSSREGERLRLRLFNPFPEDANLNVTVMSEFGPEVLAELEAVSVASRGWRDMEISQLLPLREELAISVAVTQGFVVPSLELSAADGTGDGAVWPGTGRSRTWELPLVAVGGLSPVLAIFNPGEVDVPVEVDLFTTSGPEVGVVTDLVPPGEELRIPLAELEQEVVFGVRVRGEGPVSAVIRGSGEAGRAASPGLSERARRWLVPGPGAVPEARHSLWLLNTGEEAITVTLRPLDEEGAGESEKIQVPAGTVRRMLMDVGPTSGVMAEALGPFTVAWSAELEGAVVYGAASPVDE